MSTAELDSYVHGELSPEEQAELEARIEGDLDAERRLDIMRNLDALIATHPAAQGREEDPEPMAPERFARIEANLALWVKHRIGHGGSLPHGE